MKRNLLLALVFLVSIILAVNSTKRILVFRTNAQKVDEAQRRLEALRAENEALKRDLEHKQSEQFAEGEIRNKLGLVREGEAMVIVPKEEDKQEPLAKGQSSSGRNLQKWWKLFFGS
jgi:cell division protein FtsB